MESDTHPIQPKNDITPLSYFRQSDPKKLSVIPVLTALLLALAAVTVCVFDVLRMDDVQWVVDSIPTALALKFAATPIAAIAAASLSVTAFMAVLSVFKDHRQCAKLAAAYVLLQTGFVFVCIAATVELYRSTGDAAEVVVGGARQPVTLDSNLNRFAFGAIGIVLVVHSAPAIWLLVIWKRLYHAGAEKGHPLGHSFLKT